MDNLSNETVSSEDVESNAPVANHVEVSSAESAAEPRDSDGIMRRFLVLEEVCKRNFGRDFIDVERELFPVGK